MLIAVYNSRENHEEIKYNPQVNNPKRGEVVVIEQQDGYFFLPEYPTMKNGVTQVFHPSHFRNPTYGEYVTFKLQYDENKVAQ